MEIIYFLLPLSLVMAIIALIAFVWGVRKEQFDDVDSAAVRMLFDDDGGEKTVHQKEETTEKM